METKPDPREEPMVARDATYYRAPDALRERIRASIAAEGIGVGQSVSDDNPEVILLQSANRKLVNQALEQLPVGYREVIVMREIEDLSYKEIASIAGIPTGTVMSRLSRGREMLKREIETRMRRAS